MKWLPSIAVLIGALSSFAQEERNEVFISQTGRVEMNTRLEDLPAHLKPTPDTLSLRADFKNQKDGQVTLYLVNATKKKTLVQAQDNNLYCKREAKGADGEWRRCDSHEFSWCGNSYSRVELPAGGFLSWSQKLDSEQGEARPVRFRFFSGDFAELESNEGLGKVAEADIKFCRYDAMAMEFGPFEDVMAVATGEVVGSQGSSMGGNSGIGALQRFSGEERLFPGLKKVVAHLMKRSDPHGNNSRDYDTCLGALAKTMGRTIRAEDAWDYVVSHVKDPKFPWSGVAMDWLTDHFETRWREKQDLAESILTKPKHQALRSAIRAYAKVAEKDETGPRLEAISKDKRYSEDDRDYAREVREELFPNPYLRISIDQTDPSAEKESVNDGKIPQASFLLSPGGSENALQPLKSVTIANISPQTITLPVEKAEDLIFVRMVGNDNGGNQKSLVGSGQLRLKPGEKIVLHAVKWWRGIDPAEVKKSEKTSFSFIFHAATPGLWDFPAQAGSWISADRYQLLEALQKKP